MRINRVTRLRKDDTNPPVSRYASSRILKMDDNNMM